MINTDCLKLFEKENTPKPAVYWQVWNQVWDKVEYKVRKFDSLYSTLELSKEVSSND